MAEYVNSKKLLVLLKEYHETGSKKIHNKIGKCFLLIAVNLLNKPRYINRSPDRKDEMISDAVFYMSKYIKKFDVTRENANPFAYFTTVAKRAFLQNIEKYNKRREKYTSIEYLEEIDRI